MNVVTSHQPFGFFVLRTPALPLQRWLRWSDQTNVIALRESLGTLVDDIREAIALASPSLHSSIEVWRKRAESERGASMERSLVQYVSRMASRPTPFGLFASCSLGKIAERNHLRLGAGVRRTSRVDGDWLAREVARVSAHAAAPFQPNTTLYEHRDEWRYVERASDGSCALVSLERDLALDAALARAAHGASREEIAAAIDTDDDDAAAAFVDELIAQQVLVSALEPPLTGPEPLPELARRLARCSIPAEHLIDIAGTLLEVDECGGSYSAVAKKARSASHRPVAPVARCGAHRRTNRGLAFRVGGVATARSVSTIRARVFAHHARWAYPVSLHQCIEAVELFVPAARHCI